MSTLEESLKIIQEALASKIVDVERSPKIRKAILEIKISDRLLLIEKIDSEKKTREELSGVLLGSVFLNTLVTDLRNTLVTDLRNKLKPANGLLNQQGAEDSEVNLGVKKKEQALQPTAINWDPEGFKRKLKISEAEKRGREQKLNIAITNQTKVLSGNLAGSSSSDDEENELENELNLYSLALNNLNEEERPATAPVDTSKPSLQDLTESTETTTNQAVRKRPASAPPAIANTGFTAGSAYTGYGSQRNTPIDDQLGGISVQESSIPKNKRPKTIQEVLAGEGTNLAKVLRIKNIVDNKMSLEGDMLLLSNFARELKKDLDKSESTATIILRNLMPKLNQKDTEKATSPSAIFSRSSKQSATSLRNPPFQR